VKNEELFVFSTKNPDKIWSFSQPLSFDTKQNIALMFES